MKKYIFIFLLGTLFIACDEYLDELPSKSNNLPLETIEQLDGLLGNFNNFVTEDNRTAVFSTQDWETSDVLYDGYNGSLFKSMEVIQASTWDVEYLPFDGREDLWGAEYTKIFYANMVLQYIDGVSGSEAQKAELVAEANLIKANSYWLLANTYSLPYNANNMDEPGITLKNSVSFEENTSRTTIEKTYQEIEHCLTEALKLSNPLISGGKFRPWRGNKSAAKALAARYYLSINDYNKALDFATQALGDYAVLIDYNTEMSFYDYNVTVGGAPVVVQMPSTYNSTTTDMISYKEFYYSRLGYTPYAWFVPSGELMALYDTAVDLRYKYHIVEDCSYTHDNTSISYPGYVALTRYNIPSGPTTSEMILIKAEAQARLGDWQAGMTTLEILRKKRIDSGNYSALQVNSQEAAVKTILEERRRERPFVFTWYDYRRYNNNEVAYDDVNLLRQFYPYNSSAVLSGEPLKTYELKKGDRRWARPLPSTELETSLGVIQQNSY